jgi:anti-sigma factor RsiW
MTAELTCKELVELVTDYLEDLLPSAERARFELHLRACPDCRVYLAQMRAVIALSGSLAETDLEPEARGELLAVFRDWRGN